MSHTISTSNYVFTREYSDSKERKLKVTVTLEVDHLGGKYKIKPSGTSRQEFGFVGDSSVNSTMWKAVTEVIQEAIDFAETIINPTAVKDEQSN